MLEIHKITGLRAQHFADLIRTAQLVFDPARGVSGRYLKVDWEKFGIPLEVVENLQSLGQQYQFASPHIPVEDIWEKLTPETRRWFVEKKDYLWQFEEAFPAFDED
ncbi:hypothetical protein H6S82_24935 [Planktothrix sp. FACHB-1355]|uniref:Uncharacterized protein n=1 Tax=Aerosakkonema funiforme FACHB-1375 TaxID=2949571 RepID=A0A926VKF6_9CYAN|nr:MULTISPECIES: hypothetical protein [Oscillatoriales]MBD2185460.1 hypothetical protein [Aerosakkonema funiforme FACHB-1375]MBD3562065.1 hypothetical protein [Planktothrix sp. FACHB-1355]